MVITKNIISAMASGVNYFYCCLLLTQHKYYFWNSAAFAFSSIDLTVKQNIDHLYALYCSQIPTPPEVNDLPLCETSKIQMLHIV